MGRASRLVGTPRSPKGRIAKGNAAEAEVKALLEALGCEVHNFAPAESGQDLLAVWVPAEAKRFGPWEAAPALHRWSGVPLAPGVAFRYHAIIEVKSRPWAYIAGSERRACIEAREKAARSLCLYWVVAPVPGRNKEGGRDGPLEWELIVPHWIGEKARILHRWPLPSPPTSEPRVADGPLPGLPPIGAPQTLPTFTETGNAVGTLSLCPHGRALGDGCPVCLGDGGESQ